MDGKTQFDMTLVVTPIVAALVGLAVWFIQSRVEEIRNAEARLRDERRQIYAEILDPFIRIFADVNNAKHAVKQVSSYDYKKAAFELMDKTVKCDRI